MIEPTLLSLAQVVLPSEVLDNFDITKVEEAGFHSFNVIATTFYEHYDDILNFYNNRSSNAAAESFNAKIKQFRTALRGVVDEKFFLFRLAKIYAYPQ